MNRGEGGVIGTFANVFLARFSQEGRTKGHQNSSFRHSIISATRTFSRLRTLNQFRQTAADSWLPRENPLNINNSLWLRILKRCAKRLVPYCERVGARLAGPWGRLNYMINKKKCINILEHSVGRKEKKRFWQGRQIFNWSANFFLLGAASSLPLMGNDGLFNTSRSSPSPHWAFQYCSGWFVTSHRNKDKCASYIGFKLCRQIYWFLLEKQSP